MLSSSTPTFFRSLHRKARAVMPFIAVLLMEILAGAEVDLFIPSFPELQQLFNLTPFMVELTLGVNLTAYCIASLIVGTLGDKYGRRPIILIGLGIFIVGSFLCVFAPSYLYLLIGRALQGMGMASPAVLSYLVIADMYSTEKQQQLMGIINGSISLAMASAPVIGSYITAYFQWHGNFIFLLGFGILCALLSYIWVPHTGVRNPNVSLSLREYIPVISSPKAMLYASTISFLVLSYWIFIGIAPILYMEGMKVPLKEFGYYQGSMAAIFSVASFSSGFFLRRFGQQRCFNFSVGLLFLFIFLLLTIQFTRFYYPLAITMLMQLLSLSIVFPINILWPLSLEAVPGARGRITAIVSAGRLLLTAAGLEIVSFFYHGTFAPLGWSIFVSLSTALLLGYFLLRCDRTIFTKKSS